jgi:hypothetical protein
MTDYGLEDKDGSKLLSLHLYYAEQTEKLIERRAANSRYFLTINTGFVAILGLALKHDPAGGTFWLVALPLAGIVACVLWAQLTRSYRILIGARFKVIGEMEARLPVAPYTEEWRRIKESPDHRVYTSISRLEGVVPSVFAVIYAVLLIAPLLVAGATTAASPPSL